jgi:hypothetical protein
MSHTWNTTILNSEAEIFHVLTELRGKRWLCRGQSKSHGGLVPSIDRPPRQNLSRADKLKLERRSIDLFQSTARFFSDQGEQRALHDDIIALMVLRHYGVPTRLLDWSMSPWVAAYFAARHHDNEEGELWSFDEPLYEQKGAKQWKECPVTTTDGSGDGHKFRAQLTAFTIDQPYDWFICNFYPQGFPRQRAQHGAYSMTARFARDHADSIANLLGDESHYHRYVVRAELKPTLLRYLRENHGIWRGSLFPDPAGAAETARTAFPTV